MHSHTFPKGERLKSRKLIGQLFREGKPFSIYPFKIYYLFPEERERLLQAGFAVPAKRFKKAVHRNRIKRLTREAYRLQKEGLEQALQNKQQQLAVFFVYTGSELPLFEPLSCSVRSIIQKLTRIVYEKTPVHP